MRTAKFGKTGPEVPVIGQGTWFIEQARHDDAVSSLRLGLDLGLNHIDTAEMYGDGAAEEVVDVEDAVGEHRRPIVGAREHPSVPVDGHGLLDERAVAAARLNAATIASLAAGVPVRLLRNDVDEVYERARVVRNIVEPDDDVPTLAEVREILDTPIESENEAGEAESEGAPPGAG